MSKKTETPTIPSINSGTWYIELYKTGEIKKTIISPELRQMLGYDDKAEFPDALDSLLNSLHPDDQKELLEKSIAAAVSGSMACDTNLRLKTKNDAYIPVNSTLRLIRLPNGTPYMLHGVIMDISVLNIPETSKTVPNNDTPQATPTDNSINNTTSFIYNISQKMLTPMNSMKEFTNILENNLMNEKLARDYIEEIRNSQEFLMSLVNNILDMARIEGGMTAVEESYGNINNLMKSIANQFKLPMKEKKIKFSTTVKVDHPEIMVDFAKVKEILVNLISNAHKYTPAGGKIEVTINELPHDKPDYALYQTTISDTGVGIAKEALPHIFDAFSKNSAAAHEGILGTGLGMYIVKELVTMLGGTIEVRSELGKGTDFIVAIPHRIAGQSITQESAENTASSRGEKAHKMRILLAEDNDLNADIATALLEDKGFTIKRAKDGAQCVDMLKASTSGYYDVILMDVQMPNMTGNEATKTIRRLKNAAHNSIPIIAMTANASDADKREALLVGMNAHVAKPFDPDKLYATIFNVLDHKSYYIHSDALDTFKKKYAKMGCECGFFVYNIDWEEKITFADQATAKIFGCADEAEFLQHVNGSFKTLVHANDIEQVQKAITQQQSSSTANLDLVDYDIIRKDGQIRHLADIGYKVFDGEKLVYFVYIADITDMKK